ncbi:MAG: glycerophosphodiester phosphodiesterase family protein [Cyclobacteriaceae bacterium]|nr:glycerophosphodiester phosphodiesterase family protein [Cyclobacteriaceae bacterium]
MLRIILLGVFFSIQFITNAQVKITGHRGGYYSQYPESSVSLFQFLSEKFKPDTIIIEIDLRTSKDKTLYVLHDETLDRTTTGSGKISDKTDAELNKLRLKTINNAVADQPIPTFDAVLNFIRARNINLMLDIKEPIHQQVLELVKKHKLENRVLVLTFRKDYTRLVAENYPQVLLSTLIETEEDFSFVRNLPHQLNKRIAYVNAKTPVELLTRLRTERILIMADVSEYVRNNGKPLHANAYKTKVQQQQLDILISDFPLEARADLK